jgi:peptidoglycan-associated lipoprotein
VSNSQPAPTNNNAEIERVIRGTLEQMVFFDYDSSSIRADSKQTLDAKVPLLRQHTGFTIVIEGHADERGSTEYNLALGTRRAASVMDYLVGFGLDTGRFRTFSYGEERPLAPGSDEAAWSRNRRAEFRVSGGITER